MLDTNLENLPLGKTVEYPQVYDPSLLFPIDRNKQRSELGLSNLLPFRGVDIWNAYELSWLESSTGKPRIAVAEFCIPCDSANIVESKSFKLYLNSIAHSSFKNEAELKEVLQADISGVVGAKIRLHMQVPPFDHFSHPLADFSGQYLDDLPVIIDTFQPNAEFLTVDAEIVEESLYSNLLKSNCPVTSQPDWGSVYIRYRGRKINPIGLLKYIISYREHVGFSEQCVERMFLDILQYCQPEKLTVYARYTRRGGMDINPFRSNFQRRPVNIRHLRQ